MIQLTSIPGIRLTLFLVLLMLQGCAEGDRASSSEGENNQSAEQTTASTAPKPDKTFRTIEWTDLLPEDDLDAILNPPESLSEIEDGSPEDQIASQIQTVIAQASDSRYQQALVSTRVIPEFDGQDIRLPGFVVPLEFSEEQQIVTRFFLVPYFGACIHVPPPPPNQLVYAEFDEGFKLESLNDPVWISGTLSTAIVENDIAKSAYKMTVDKVQPYP